MGSGVLDGRLGKQSASVSIRDNRPGALFGQSKHRAEEVVPLWMGGFSPMIKNEVRKFITEISALDWEEGST